MPLIGVTSYVFAFIFVVSLTDKVS